MVVFLNEIISEEMIHNYRKSSECLVNVEIGAELKLYRIRFPTYLCHSIGMQM